VIHCHKIMRYIFLLFISTVSFAQQTAKVDFTTLKASLQPNAIEKSISGQIEYQFNVVSAIDTIRIDAKNMTFSDLKINNKVVPFKNNNKELLLFEGFLNGKNKLTFHYSVKPKQTLYFIGEGDNLQIWTQGQGKYTSHWLPSFDDVNEKVIFNLEVAYDAAFTVLANGQLKNNKSVGNSNVWQYTMKQPMSSYLVMLAIGKFINQKQSSNSGVALEFYLDRKDASKFEPTYRYSKTIFDFLEKEIGVKYPWKVYRQVPVRDFLYGGMENTTSTLFAQDFVIDGIGFNDKNYVNVNAHELAHQWFGDMVTAKSGKHHWLQEGFATYYALLAEKEVFGENYFYAQLHKSAMQLQNAAKTDTIPVMNERASSLSFYQKGAWALHVIREAIGEKAFQEAVKSYLKKHQFKNVETDDFLAEIRKVSNFDTETFQKKWLESAVFYYDEAIQMLTNKSVFIRDYLKIRNQAPPTDARIMEVIDEYRTLLQSDSYYPIKEEIIFKISKLNYKSNKDLVELAINSDDYKVRQAVADHFPKVPSYLKDKYETLLNDSSYTTREVAFNNLWDSFPEERENYLIKSKEWIGNNDKSLRIQYLMLAQLSKNLDNQTKENLYKALQNYTSTNFESSIRQNATDAILSINPKDEIVLKNLINAISHFKWQFSKYAKDQIRALLKKNEMRLVFEKILPDLNPNDQAQLKKLL
jgi:aminopeptidase N